MGFQSDLPHLVNLWPLPGHPKFLHTVLGPHRLCRLRRRRKHPNRYHHLFGVHSSKQTLFTRPSFHFPAYRRGIVLCHRLRLHPKMELQTRLFNSRPSTILSKCGQWSSLLLEVAEYGLSISSVHARCHHVDRVLRALRRLQISRIAQISSLPRSGRPGGRSTAQYRQNQQVALQHHAANIRAVDSRACRDIERYRRGI